MNTLTANTRFARPIEDFMSLVNKKTIGFEDMVDRFLTTPAGTVSNYPVYNLVKESEDTYLLELAIAGFNKEDITISVENQILTVEGQKEKEERDYIYRGIAERAFTRRFPLAEYIEVKDAEMVDGILKIRMIREIPEEMKAKKVDIK